MKLLLDTHVLLWAAARPERLSAKARRLLRGEQNQLLFSAASLWEIDNILLAYSAKRVTPPTVSLMNVFWYSAGRSVRS